MDQKIRTIGIMIAAVVVGSALLDQLRRPPEQRTWQGSLIGIPYDFRLPTPERIQEKVWNKNTSRLVMPQLFGVGWSLNFYPLLHPKAVQD